MANWSPNEKYMVIKGSGKQSMVCYNDTMPLSVNNKWEETNPFIKLLPIFTLQLSCLIALTHIMMFIFRPLRQPRFFCETLVGVFLGSTALNYVSITVRDVFTPFEGGLSLETIADLGLTLYMFLAGVQMDLSPIRKIGKLALSVAISGLIVPITLGAGLHKYLQKYENPENVNAMGVFFWTIALCVTSFSDLTRILSDLKLMYTDLAKIALTAAAVSDLACWSFLMVAISMINGKDRAFLTFVVMLVIVCFFFAIRPIIIWMLKKIPKASGGASNSDTHMNLVISLVLLCGVITDLCGAHSMFGAFMLGLIIPPGMLGTTILNKIEEFVFGILLPPIFLATGMATKIEYIFKSIPVVVVLLIILLACSAKIVSTLLVCFFFKSSKRDALAFGVLMNTKGILALIIMNEGRNMQVIHEQAFTIITVAILVMTFIIGPVVSCIYKSSRDLKPRYDRTLEKSIVDVPLRVLACVHSIGNLSGLINLLQISNATRKSPIIVFAVHLVELTRQTSAMVIFHDKNKTIDVGNRISREKAGTEQIIDAFESLENNNHAYTVKLLTAVSPYDSMHEDISNFACDKLANIILIPFHKQPNIAGGWIDGILQHQQVNKKLLEIAPCSIGLLVDRGLTLDSQDDKRQCRVAMFFLEGPDDREALAYARRMAGTSSLILIVVRFLLVDVSKLANIMDKNDESTTSIEEEEEKQIDDAYLNEFRFRTMHDTSITHIEKKVNGGDQIMSIVMSDYSDFDLYVVGRGHLKSSALSIKSELPELGRLGETLALLEVRKPASVLVVQRYASQYL